MFELAERAVELEASGLDTGARESAADTGGSAAGAAAGKPPAARRRRSRPPVIGTHLEFDTDAAAAAAATAAHAAAEAARQAGLEEHVVEHVATEAAAQHSVASPTAPARNTAGSLRIQTRGSGSARSDEVFLPGSVTPAGGVTPATSTRARGRRTSVDAATAMLHGHEVEKAAVSGLGRRRRSLSGAPTPPLNLSRGFSVGAESAGSVHSGDTPTAFGSRRQRVTPPGHDGSEDGDTQGSERLSTSARWTMLRAAVHRDVRVGHAPTLNDVLGGARGRVSRSHGGSMDTSDGTASEKRPRSTKGGPFAASLSPLSGDVDRAAQHSALRIWCFAPVKTAIPARDRENVRAIVFHLPHSTTIDPECRFATIWQVLMFCVIVAQAFGIPYRLAFDPVVSRSSWTPGLTATDMLFYLLDVFYVADIVISLLTGYIENGNKVMDPATVRRRYLRMPHVLLEVLSALPYDFVIYLVAPSTATSMCLFSTRLTRLLRCRHLPRLFAGAEEAGGVHLRNLNQVIKMLTYVLLLIHLQGSLWFRLSGALGFSSDGADSDQSFLAPPTLRDAPESAQYISALYWALRQATSEGIVGNPNPESYTESFLSLFVTLSGILLVSYLIGAVARLVSQLDASWAQHTERLSQVNRFLAHNGLSEELGREITAFYEFSFDESGGRDIQEVASNLSVTLQGQLAVIMTHDILRKVPLFADVEEGLVVSMARTLTSMTVQRDELVMRAGLPCKRVFLVHWGSLNVEVGGSGDMRAMRKRQQYRRAKADKVLQGGMVKTPWGERLLLNAIQERRLSGVLDNDDMREEERQPGRVVERLSAGSFFGQYVAEAKGYVPSTSVRASTFCILYALEHSTLKQVMQRFPESQKKIERLLMRQRRRSLGAIDAARRRSGNAKADEKGDGGTWVVAAAGRFLRAARRSTPTCGERWERVVKKSPCVWVFRDCFVRGTRKSLERSRDARNYSDDLRDPRQRLSAGLSPRALHTPATVLRRRRSTEGLMSPRPAPKIGWSKARKAVRTLITPTYHLAGLYSNVGMGSSGSVVSTRSPGHSFTAGRASARGSRYDMGAAGAAVLHGNGPRVINPDSHFRWIWQTLMQFAVLYNIVTVPIRIGFSQALLAGENRTLAALDFVVDILYLCDLLVKSRMAFYVRGVLVMDPETIFRSYLLGGGFWRDFLSAVPIDWFVATAWWTRANKLVRASRVIAWFRSWLSRWTLSNSASQAVASTLLQLVLMLLMSFHYLSCLYWPLATASRDSHTLWHDDTFSAPAHLDDASVAQQYLYSSLRVAHPRGLLRAGTPPTAEAALFSFVVTIYGLFLFAYVIGALGTAIADSDASAASFRRRKLAVERFMAMRRVPDGMQDRVSHWFKAEWQSNHGLSVDAVCAELPSLLARRLRFELCQAGIRAVPIFSSLDDSAVAQLAEIVRVELLAEEQLLYHAGELGSDMLVVVGGALSLYFGDDAGRHIQNVTGAMQKATQDLGSRDYEETKSGAPAKDEHNATSELPSGDARPGFTARPDFGVPPEMSDPFTTVGPGDIAGEFAYFEGVRLTTAVAVCATEVYVIGYGPLHDMLEEMPFLEARMRLAARRKLEKMAQLVDEIYERHCENMTEQAASEAQAKALEHVSVSVSTPAAGSPHHVRPPSDSVSSTRVADLPPRVSRSRSSPDPLVLAESNSGDAVSQPVPASSPLAVAGGHSEFDGGVDGAASVDSGSVESSIDEDLCKQAEAELAQATIQTTIWRPPSFAASGSLAAVHFRGTPGALLGVDEHGGADDAPRAALVAALAATKSETTAAVRSGSDVRDVAPTAGASPASGGEGHFK